MDYDGQIINIYRLSYNTADGVQYIVSAHEQYTIDSQSGMSDKKLVEYVSDYFQGIQHHQYILQEKVLM